MPPAPGAANPLGEYLLGRTIGEGTFGKVKLGTHLLTGERVAVKILERERIREPADVERVAREIHILGLIRHPHIIKLHEIIETPEQLFLIMEYCNGGELFDHIVEKGRLEEKEACRILHQIISGVEQIHRVNVVHRDMKPENLLLDEHGNIKIVDFGLSNMFRDGQLLKTACGSPCYAAPEMIADQWYVPSLCDVWSCGVIVFALVCGFLPFEDDNHAELYRKILNAEYTIPRFVSKDARELIRAMLTTDPEKRATIADLRQMEWFQQIPDAASSDAGERAPDEGVLAQLTELGYTRGHARGCLTKNKHNAVTTAYNLLLEKQRRAADSIKHVKQAEAEKERRSEHASHPPEGGAPDARRYQWRRRRGGWAGAGEASQPQRWRRKDGLDH